MTVTVGIDGGQSQIRMFVSGEEGIQAIQGVSHLESSAVDAVVEVPFGCTPHECYGTYEPFFDHMGQYAKQVSIDPVAGAADYLRHYYQEPATWEAYLERVGTTQILDASRRGRSVYDD